MAEEGAVGRMKRYQMIEQIIIERLHIIIQLAGKELMSMKLGAVKAFYKATLF